MTKATFLFLLLLASRPFSPAGHPSPLDSIDVFPLEVGNSYLYTFDRTSTWWSFGYSVFFRDSGRVRSTIIDSATATDTTVDWIVLEQWEGLHWEYTNQGEDTVYALSDSLVLQLSEITEAYHRLESTSSVWDFPVEIPYDHSFPVFRYADSASILLSGGPFGCYCCFGTNFDSLWFSADSGLVKRSYDYCTDNDEEGSGSWGSFVLTSATIVSVDHQPPIQSGMRLSQNYPNPFNPSTTIRFSLPGSGEVSLKVFNLLGEEVATVISGHRNAGTHTVQWDATGHPTGVYFYRLRARHKDGGQAGEFLETRKLVLVR